MCNNGIIKKITSRLFYLQYKWNNISNMMSMIYIKMIKNMDLLLENC